jgi:hypothetical protein
MIGKNSIPNPRRGEEVIIHLRRHPLIIIGIGLFFVLLASVPLLLYIFAQSYEVFDTTFSETQTWYPVIKVIGYSYYLLLIVFAITAWTDYYLDTWTITTDRIINREQYGLFNRIVSELDISNIQDVTAEQKGIAPTFFHYGTVYIQSAAEKERFLFEQIPDPYRIAKMIQKLHETSKRA